VNISREYQVSFLMAGTAFFTLAGYEFIRSSSTVLFKTAYGAENLPLVLAAMPFVVFAGVALYGRILTHLGPRRTLMVTSMGSLMLIVACYLAVLSGSKMITPVLYLTKEFYIVLLIEQYWSYINSSIKAGTARKVNGPITFVSGLGATAGGHLLGIAAEPLGTATMVLLGGLFILPAVALGDYTYRRFGEPERPPTEKASSDMGWSLFKENPVLVYLLAIVLSSQMVSIVLDLKFQELLSLQFVGEPDKETAFQGRFFGSLNLASGLLQVAIAPLLMTAVSLRFIHICLPLIHFVAIGYAFIEPSVWSVGVAFFLFKALDYSIFRAAKEILYIPLSFDARYRAKEDIDVFGYRTGKGATSVAIVVLQRAGVVMGNFYLGMALVATAVWLLLIFPLTSKAEATQDED